MAATRKTTSPRYGPGQAVTSPPASVLPEVHPATPALPKQRQSAFNDLAKVLGDVANVVGVMGEARRRDVEDKNTIDRLEAKNYATRILPDLVTKAGDGTSIDELLENAKVPNASPTFNDAVGRYVLPGVVRASGVYHDKIQKGQQDQTRNTVLNGSAGDSWEDFQKNSKDRVGLLIREGGHTSPEAAYKDLLGTWLNNAAATLDPGKNAFDEAIKYGKENGHLTPEIAARFQEEWDRSTDEDLQEQKATFAGELARLRNEGADAAEIRNQLDESVLRGMDPVWAERQEILIDRYEKDQNALQLKELSRGYRENYTRDLAVSDLRDLQTRESGVIAPLLTDLTVQTPNEHGGISDITISKEDRFAEAYSLFLHQLDGKYGDALRSNKPEVSKKAQEYYIREKIAFLSDSGGVDPELKNGLESVDDLVRAGLEPENVSPISIKALDDYLYLIDMGASSLLERHLKDPLAKTRLELARFYMTKKGEGKKTALASAAKGMHLVASRDETSISEMVSYSDNDMKGALGELGVNKNTDAWTVYELERLASLFFVAGGGVNKEQALELAAKRIASDTALLPSGRRVDISVIGLEKPHVLAIADILTNFHISRDPIPEDSPYHGIDAPVLRQIKHGRESEPYDPRMDTLSIDINSHTGNTHLVDANNQPKHDIHLSAEEAKYLINRLHRASAQNERMYQLSIVEDRKRKNRIRKQQLAILASSRKGEETPVFQAWNRDDQPDHLDLLAPPSDDQPDHLDLLAPPSREAPPTLTEEEKKQGIGGEEMRPTFVEILEFALKREHRRTEVARDPSRAERPQTKSHKYGANIPNLGPKLLPHWRSVLRLP